MAEPIDRNPIVKAKIKLKILFEKYKFLEDINLQRKELKYFKDYFFNKLVLEKMNNCLKV